MLLGFAFMALIAVVFAALGTIIGSSLKDMQGFQLVMNFLVMPIFFLSGALYPLSNLPTALTVLTRLDPLSYGVDGLRGRVHRPVALRRADRPRGLLGLAACFLALGRGRFRGFRCSASCELGRKGLPPSRGSGILNRMATDLPPVPDSTIDVSGLPEPVVRVVRDLVDTLRSNLGGPTAAGMGGARKPLGGRLAHLNLKVPAPRRD